MSDMKSTWLVQRLKRPFGELDTPFSAAGPFKDGVCKALKTAFSLDYMGSSEFEYGAVGEAVDVLAKRQLHTKTIELTVSASEQEKTRAAISLDQARKSRGRDRQEILELRAIVEWMKEPRIVPIYILAPANLMDHAEKFIRHNAENPYGGLQEMTFLRANLLHERYHENHVGWFELDNGFMFFTDKTMFERTAAIFGVALAPSPAEALRETVPHITAQPVEPVTAPH